MMRITILAKRWLLRFVEGREIPGKRGDCDPPETPNKSIRVWRELTGEERLEVVIHEILHASDWHKDEDSWIAPLAKDLARVLWKLGYRAD